MPKIGFIFQIQKIHKRVQNEVKKAVEVLRGMTKNVTIEQSIENDIVKVTRK